MDVGSVGGIVFAIVCILGGQALEGGHAGSLVQATAFIIVVGGTIGAVAVAFPPPIFVKGIKMAGMAFTRAHASFGALLGTITSPSREPGSSRRDAFSATEPRRGMPGLALLEMNPGAPGSSVTGRMEVVNSTREYMDAISPKCDVLVGTGGRSIPGHCVSFVPRITDVKPNDGQQFIITIHIPDSARRGSYSGLITVTGHPAVRLLVHLDVN